MTKILLVEDNDLAREALSRRLERKGYKVVLASDGLAGMAMAEAETPDLIVMDMNLPILDGWEATRQLKSREPTRSIPIVALTVNTMSGDREKALAAGCDEQDTRPVDHARLLGKLEALLQRGKAF